MNQPSHLRETAPATCTNRPATLTSGLAPVDFNHPGRPDTVFRISKKFSFEASHQLTGLPDGHKCGRLHGHSYDVCVWIRATKLDNNGFVTDFADLSALAAYLDEWFDHRHLNEFIAQPTSENLAKHLYEWCVANLALPSNATVDRVKVSETAKTWAEYAPDAPVVGP